MQEAVSKFVSELKESGVFAKEVRSAGVAFHSYYMASIAPALLAALKRVRRRLTVWLSPKPNTFLKKTFQFREGIETKCMD